MRGSLDEVRIKEGCAWSMHGSSKDTCLRMRGVAPEECVATWSDVDCCVQAECSHFDRSPHRTLAPTHELYYWRQEVGSLKSGICMYAPKCTMSV